MLSGSERLHSCNDSVGQVVLRISCFSLNAA
jgi:hypothetical protein